MSQSTDQSTDQSADQSADQITTDHITSGVIKRRAWSLLGNSQRLDGGAMFGNAPRALWSRWIEPDELNRIPLACRCLLIEEERADGIRRILCEAGIGAFFEPKLRERFGVVEREHMLLERLATIGLSPDDIDIVVLSHLHFDHAGGLLSAWREDEPSELVFKRARYVIGAEALERARTPHARDRASFIPRLIELLTELQTESGRLEIIGRRGEGDQERLDDEPLTSALLGAGYRLRRCARMASLW